MDLKLTEVCVCGLYLTGSGEGPVTGSWDHGNEPKDFKG